MYRLGRRECKQLLYYDIEESAEAIDWKSKTGKNVCIQLFSSLPQRVSFAHSLGRLFDPILVKDQALRAAFVGQLEFERRFDASVRPVCF